MCTSSGTSALTMTVTFVFLSTVVWLRPPTTLPSLTTIRIVFDGLAGGGVAFVAVSEVVVVDVVVVVVAPVVVELSFPPHAVTEWGDEKGRRRRGPPGRE